MSTNPETPPLVQQEKDKKAFSYTGTCGGCGAMTAAAMSDMDKRSLSQFVARIVRCGDVVGTATVEEVRQRLANCTCTKPPKKAARQLAMLGVTNV